VAQLFSVRLQPKASRNEVRRVLTLSGEVALAVRVTAPPVEGQANKACLEALARALDVPKSSLTIVAGARSRDKTIRLEGLAETEWRARLDALAS
jgi:uncharacterized protein (TIGR00251 family)